jgi:sugar/nucleoside kinase (ribokinase family)
MKRYDIYGIGAALVDTEVEVNDAFLASAGIDKGVMTLVDEARQHELMEHLSTHLVGARRASGGSAANSVIATTLFGGRAFFSGKVADDDNGRFYLHDMKTAGVTTPDGALPEGITGKCLVMITDDAERTMNTFLGISETLSREQINEDALKASHYLYIEGYLVTSPTGRDAAIHARTLAEQHGVKTALSFSDPGIVAHFRDGLRDMVGAQLDMVFCNESEAMSWAGTDTLDAAIPALKQAAKTFAVTCGAKGALLFDGNALIRVPGFPVKAIDTNGAGDMFAGAFLYAITHGHCWADAGRLANLAASHIVTHYGPRLPAAAFPQLLAQLNN